MSSFALDDAGEIRWIEAENQGQLGYATDRYEQGTGLGDLFADPDPMDTFTLTFHVNNSDGTHSHKGEEAKEVTIKLRGVKEENGQMLNSTGLTLRRASGLLCGYISRFPDIVRGKAVLELGAGLGSCGILAQKLGARRVFLTDGDTDVLFQMRQNVKLNVGEGDAVECRQLRWGTDTHNFKHCFCNPSGVGHDLTKGKGFDVIMGSDIIYVEEMLEPLFKTVLELLAPESSTAAGEEKVPKFLLAFARRNVGIDLVVQCAERHGLKCLELEGSAEGIFVFTRIVTSG